MFIFSTPVLIRHLWQLNTAVFLQWCLMCSVILARPLYYARHERLARGKQSGLLGPSCEENAVLWVCQIKNYYYVSQFCRCQPNVKNYVQNNSFFNVIFVAIFIWSLLLECNSMRHEGCHWKSILIKKVHCHPNLVF